MRATAFALVALPVVATAGVAPGCARAASHCAPAIAADPRLGQVDPETRLAWIDGRLAEGRRSAALWSWSWGLGIGASGVASLAVVPFVSHEERVDWYTSAASAAVGVIPLVLTPPAVMRDARELRATLSNRRARQAASDSPADDVCALLADAEARLVADAEDQRRQRAWWFHAGNVAFNTGITLFLGLGFHRWTSGLINGVAGFVVGEALLLTQPTRTIDDLASYRKGELSKEDTATSAQSGWSVTYARTF